MGTKRHKGPNGRCASFSTQLPAHLLNRTELLAELRRCAALLRRRYRFPVYLVGSALRANNPRPRDWDIRVYLPAAAFAARYAGRLVTSWRPAHLTAMWAEEITWDQWSAMRWRWWDDCQRQEHALAALSDLSIDFQVHPLGLARTRFRGLPRARIG